MKHLKSLLLIGTLLFCVLHANAQDPASIAKYLRKTTNWKFETLNKEIPVNIYYISGSTHSRPYNIGSPVLVYIKNHGEERIGTESDSAILMDYIKQHYIVLTIDFEKNPKAISPYFDKDLHSLFKGIYDDGENSVFSGIKMEPRKYRCFFVPEGCRVATDLVFWEIDKHGANGTLELIMDRYNKKIAGVVDGKEKVKSPAEMTDRQGRPFQYKLAMDIVYPSMAKKKVPIIVYASTQVTRHPNVSPTVYRPHMAGFTMRGYAYAIIDHAYDPVRRHFWYDSGDYSLNAWNGLAANTAAIRFIRANAKKFNIDERYIGAMGHSKGEYTVARLSDPDHVNQQESSVFEGFPKGSPESQPNQGFSSQISVGYQSPGSWAQYVSSNDVPTLVAHGNKDSFGKKKYKEVFNKLDSLDNNHVALLMKGYGHVLPSGYNEELGFDRYELVHQFFDSYLKVEDKIAPVVLMISPVHQKENVTVLEPISVHFAPSIDKKSVAEGIKIIRTDDNRIIEGEWKESRKSTKFVFSPKKQLKAGNYEIIVNSAIKSQSGIHLEKKRTSKFKIRK